MQEIKESLAKVLEGMKEFEDATNEILDKNEYNQNFNIKICEIAIEFAKFRKEIVIFKESL